MRNKAISTVVATILMLMIVIALGGVSYVYISDVFTSKTATAFELIDSFNDTVTIRNSGAEPLTKVTAKLDGNDVNIAITPSLQQLVAYWSMNDGEPSQAVTDSSTYHNNGVRGVTSDPDGLEPTWFDGKFGNALNFTGLTFSYVTVPYSGSLDIGTDGKFAISVWIKRNAIGSTQSILSHRSMVGLGGFALNFSSDDSLGIVLEIGGINYYSFGYSITDTNNWYHIAVVYNSSQAKLFVNGNLQSVISVVPTITPNPNGVPLKIGASNQNGIRFKGVIDELSLYNTSLTDSEIKQLSSGLVSAGQTATIKPLASLSRGTHTLRLCASSMCNTAYLTII